MGDREAEPPLARGERLVGGQTRLDRAGGDG